MKRNLLVLVGLLVAGLALQGCMFSPYEGQNIPDATTFQTNGYFGSPGTWVSTVIGSPDDCTRSNLPTCGFVAQRFLSGLPGQTIAPFTGYPWNSMGGDFDLTAANWRNFSACLNPGINESAHAYVGAYITPCEPGAPTTSDVRNCAVPLSYFMDQEPVSCWGANGSNWTGFNANCVQSDPVEIFFDQPDCETEPPAGFVCDESNGVTVCFPETWPNGANPLGSVDVIINFENSDPSSATQCVTDGPGTTCLPTTDPRVGFYQDGDPLCILQGSSCEEPLWDCVSQGGGYDLVCTGELVARDQLGVFAANSPDSGGFFASPNY